MVVAVNCDNQVQAAGSKLLLYSDFAGLSFASAHFFGVLSYIYSTRRDSLRRYQDPGTPPQMIIECFQIAP